MAQTGYTPISIYYSATSTNVPTAGNLVAGELAINTADGFLFYKDSSGVVQTIASKSSASGSFTNLAYTGTLTGGTGIVNLGSTQFYKSATGNIGLGVTPNASDLPTIQSNYAIISGNNQTNIISNGYYTSALGFTYTSTAVAAHYRQTAGAHQFFCAPSGTINTAISFTQVLNAEKDKSIALQGATSASGTGISFPATQSASSDANTLDDYEEGTWTPVIASSAGSLTAYSSEGKYVKVGQMVTLFCAFTITTAGTAIGTANWSGAPFTAMSSSLSNRAAIGVCRENAATGNTYQVYANAGGTTGDLITLTNGAITWANGFTYIFTITYRTAA